MSVYRVVLSGGPCGGKSTAIQTMVDFLKGHDFQVYTVTEVPTLMIQSGLQYIGVSQELLLHTEAAFIKIQISMEDAVYEVARNCGKNAVIICDRGCLDVKAYLSPEMWALVLEENKGVSELHLRDARYDGVIHLVTAAIGAEKFYVNNAVRSEGIEQARHLDTLVKRAWAGHRQHHIIHNVAGQSFDDKVGAAVAALAQIVGISALETAESVFKLEPDCAWTSGPADQEFDVVVHALKDGRWVTKRGQNGIFSYTVHTNGTGRIISGREYVALMGHLDPALSVVSKHVGVFHWGESILHLLTYSKPTGLKIIRSTTPAELLVLPPELKPHAIAVDGRMYDDIVLAQSKNN